MGERGVLGVRVQPNHPTDDVAGILVSTLDGLLYGCGDAVIGVNPATESVESVAAVVHVLQEVVERLGVPTQACCLAHITTQLEAMRARRTGRSAVPVGRRHAGRPTRASASRSTCSREGREEVLAHHAHAARAVHRANR